MVTRKPSLCVVFLLCVLAVASPGGEAIAQFAPPPPVAPHPDSSEAVVAAQVASLLVAAVLLDGRARMLLAAEPESELHSLSHVGNHLGRGKHVALALGAVYGGVRLAGFEEVSTPLGRTLVALVTAGAASGMMKFTIGRARPGLNEGRASFQPFALEDRWQSFPSGHAVTAFALAAAVSEQAGRNWVTGASFGAATVVAWSRVHEDRHWTSDVAAGAILGSLVSRYTVRELRARAARSGVGDPTAQDPLGGVRLLPLPGGFAVSIPMR